jgi:hypothetical protein
MVGRAWFRRLDIKQAVKGLQRIIGKLQKYSAWESLEQIETAKLRRYARDLVKLAATVERYTKGE